jgi:hypothetical protein
MTFSISPAAAQVIRHRIERSSVERPVAAMVDCSDSLPPSRELTQALLRKASEAELRDIAKREYCLDDLKFRLEVGIYSKSQYPSWTMAMINGIEFVLPFWVRLALRKWTLDFVDDRFLLRKGDRVRYTLSGRKGVSNAA